MPLFLIKFVGPRIGSSYSKEDFEGYADGSDLNGQSGGIKWGGSYVVRSFGLTDSEDFETYTDGASLNGLNGGTLGWGGAFVST